MMGKLPIGNVALIKKGKPEAIAQGAPFCRWAAVLPRAGAGRCAVGSVPGVGIGGRSVYGHLPSCGMGAGRGGQRPVVRPLVAEARAGGAWWG